MVYTGLVGIDESDNENDKLFTNATLTIPKCVIESDNTLSLVLDIFDNSKESNYMTAFPLPVIKNFRLEEDSIYAIINKKGK